MRPALILAVFIAAVASLGARTAKRPAITGVAFARFYTTHPAGAQKFYGDTLGFKRIEANDMWIYPVNTSQWIEILTSPPPPQPNIRMAAVAIHHPQRGRPGALPGSARGEGRVAFEGGRVRGAGILKATW